MTGKKSRQKGKRGELLIASVLRRCFPDARRGRQFDSARECDVEGTPFRIEVKTRAYISYTHLKEWLEQNMKEGLDWKDDRIPLLITKRDRENHIVHLFLTDFVGLVEKFFYRFTAEEQAKVIELFKGTETDTRYKP